MRWRARRRRVWVWLRRGRVRLHRRRPLAQEHLQQRRRDSCLEVADGVLGIVPVRDGKVPDGGLLRVGHRAWGAFIGSVAGR
ncbi:DUF397 domain-containing protein [Streptomyces phaeochromogenes]|uniref:DUF397 domain-containing protein n=1 Tax=Streptomyces phaeochromogenes TaxID=1923 RepID=UPI0038705846